MEPVEIQISDVAVIASSAIFLTLGVLLVYTARRLRMLWDWTLRGSTYPLPIRIFAAAMIVAALGFALWGYYYALMLFPPTAAAIIMLAAAIGALVATYGIWLSARLTRRKRGTPLSDALHAAPQRASTLAARRAARDILKRNQTLAIENNLLVSELSLAGRVQQNLFNQVVGAPHVGMAIWHDPAGAVSGDVVHSWMGGDDDPRAANIFLGDASGHGIAAAFMTIMVHIGINGMRADRAPQEVMERLNTLLLSGNDDMFVTGLCVRISSTGYLTCANAGHLPLMIIPAGGGLPLYLTDSGIALAMFTNMPLDIRVQTHQLRPGDRVVLMTDGVTEMKGDEIEMFGMERVAAHFLATTDDALAGAVKGIADEVVQFAGVGERNRDDMLLVALEYLGEAAADGETQTEGRRPQFITM